MWRRWVCGRRDGGGTREKAFGATMFWDDAPMDWSIGQKYHYRTGGLAFSIR